MELAIITTKDRLKQAEDLFTDLMNVKEEQGWKIISHRFSNKDGNINRYYTFEKEDNEIAVLSLYTAPFDEYRKIDNVISLDVFVNDITDNYIYI